MVIFRLWTGYVPYGPFPSIRKGADIYISEFIRDIPIYDWIVTTNAPYPHPRWEWDFCYAEQRMTC